MAKIHVLQPSIVLSKSASILSSGCAISGSFTTRGYKTLRGMISCGCQMTACAVRVYQSADGTNWDMISGCATLGASAASGFEYPVYGTAGDILILPGTCNVNPFRTVWFLVPG